MLFIRSRAPRSCRVHVDKRTVAARILLVITALVGRGANRELLKVKNERENICSCNIHLSLLTCTKPPNLSIDRQQDRRIRWIHLAM